MESEVKRTEHGDKIKLEDMALKQIRELKEGYQIRVSEVLTAIQNEFMEKHDCGLPLVYISTGIKDEAFYIEYGVKSCTNSLHKYQINIKFSKEDD